MKVALAALVGFLLGLLLFAIGREIWWAFAARPVGEVVSKALAAVGSLGWIDTTLITGIAAIGAAYLSVRAVHAQIKQAEQIETERNAAKRAANRAVLPISLAALSQYAEANTSLLKGLLESCVEQLLPKTIRIPHFAQIPSGVVAALKEMVEYLGDTERKAFIHLLVAIQVQSSRLAALAEEHGRGQLTLATNLESYIIGQAEIYARAASLYNFGRGAADEIPLGLKRSEIGSALFLIGIRDSLKDELVERFNLASDAIWPPVSELAA
ncbi:hypothetical protein [Rhizobium leguminosarum]|uniref:hypothetical protein n=1 Tax=Rhizobium leguminosarum TaxID=384 RepID=UPI0014429D99|nr:hypothetical protein [Rhizobium leguminosarum]MDI5929926.1 hypothetical protein [Rhizobium leguminosarum]NKK96652.1 hypothetical protein [Rhizobium leguminosarum bv. viciae]